MCISYESSRSSLRCISNINKYLDRINLPLLSTINLSPKHILRSYFYHQDCIINFLQIKNIKISRVFMIFGKIIKKWKSYCSKNCLDNISIIKINDLFEDIIYVSGEDLLAANMIVSNEGVVGTSRISNGDYIRNQFPLLKISFIHQQVEVEYKCCSNVININKKISIDEWIAFSNDIGISLPNLVWVLRMKWKDYSKKFSKFSIKPFQFLTISFLFSIAFKNLASFVLSLF